MDIFTIVEKLKCNKKFNDRLDFLSTLDDRLDFLSTLDDRLVNNIKKTKELPDVLINIIFQYIPKEWKVTATLMGHTESVRSAQFSPDGNYIVTASSDNTVKIWRFNAGQATLTATLVEHTDWVRSAQFSPDGHYIVTASFDKTAKIWRLTPTEFERQLKTLL